VDIEIPSDVVSRRHACIRCDGNGRLFIKDLGSTNGTFVNRKQIPPHQDVPFGPETIITFATEDQYQLKFLEPDDSTRVVARLPGTVPAGEKNIFDLLAVKESVVIGRSAECDIVISDETVSRQHARIDRAGEGRYRITDLESTNGTFVNGKKVDGRADLGLDDTVLIGNFRLSLRAPTQDIRKEIAIRADRIVKQYPNGYLGLHETSIDIPAQSLLAIMGPSGCGKSTLMKALNGDDRTTRGRVLIHNLELTSNFEYLKPRIGYVPQDDIVHRELTVEQSLYFAAKLRMDNPADDVIEARIGQILKDLGIEHIRKSLVGRISGGQRKRVSIAVELLTDPLVLFLDEPTSPLDPQTIEEFLGILRSLSDKGTTVIMVTHKPEDLNYMDSVIFMAEGGHLVFYGPTAEYKEYFGARDTVEVYADISGATAITWINRYKARQVSPAANPDSVIPGQPRNLETRALRQFFWLSLRYLKIKLNDQVNTAILLAQAPVIALLLCFIFQNIVPAVPFLVSITAIWFGASNAAREIVGEFPIYRRERMFNLKIVPYIFSKLTVLTLFAAIQAMLFVSILSLRFSDVLFEGVDPAWNNPVGAVGWMVFLSSAATLMGLLLSAAMSTTEKVMTLVPIVLIPQIILAGLIARITNWGIELISWLTLARWGTEGFHIIQGKVYAERTFVNTVQDARGNVTNSTTSVQGGPADAVETLNASFLDDYRNGGIFGDLTNTLFLDALFIVALASLFFYFTWLALRKKDAV
jgi:ABC transport system ATP-binding/permease protein